MPRQKKCKSGMRGQGFWGDVWGGIKKVGGVINDGLKASKIISTVANGTGNPIIGAVAGQLGYGRNNRRGKAGRSVIKV